MNITTFRSLSGHLRVDFPPDRFGYRYLPDYAVDEAGRILLDPTTGKGVYQGVLKNPARFGQNPNPPGVLRLDGDDPDQEAMIKDLRRSAGFGNLFWEEDARVSDLASQLEGKVLITKPIEITEEHLAVIDGLAPYRDRSIPPKAFESARTHLEHGLALFKVRGISLPPDDPERNKRLLLGRIRDFLFALEEVGLFTFDTPPDADEQQGEAISA